MNHDEMVKSLAELVPEVAKTIEHACTKARESNMEKSAETWMRGASILLDSLTRAIQAHRG